MNSTKSQTFPAWFFWAGIALCLHALLLYNWHPSLQKANINLHSGKTAIQVGLVYKPKPTVEIPPLLTESQQPKTINTIKNTEFQIVDVNTKSTPISQKTLVRKDKPSPELKEIVKPEKTIKTDPTTVNERKPNQVASNQLAQGILQAEPVSGRKPHYPRRAIQKGQEGAVIVELDIDAQGKPSNIKLAKSSNYYLLDQAILKFVKNETFIPAQQVGRNVRSHQSFKFLFRLE